MFAMIANGHFEKKYTGNTVTNELNNTVHFPNKISLMYSGCTVVNLFILEDASKLLIPHIEDQFVGFVIYHSSALRNSFIDLAACSARGLLLHVV